MLRFDESPTADAWVRVPVAGRTAQSTRVEFRFSPQYVSSIGRIPADPVTRGRSSPESEKLLMEDVIELPDVLIHVAAWLVPSETEANIYHLRLDVEAPQQIKRDMFITLRWNGVLYDAFLRKDTFRFEDNKLKLPEFSREFVEAPSHDFCLMVEYKYGGKN